MPADLSPLHITIGSRFENIELVQGVLSDALVAYDLDEETRHWIDLAVREAIANAIKHGNRLAPDKQVEIDLALDGQELVVRVRDQGEGFDPRELADPLASENRLRPDGRGILYMRQFMDEIEYQFRPGEGTEVILRKRLRDDAAAGSYTGREASAPDERERP